MKTGELHTEEKTRNGYRQQRLRRNGERQGIRWEDLGWTWEFCADSEPDKDCICLCMQSTSESEARDLHGIYQPCKVAFNDHEHRLREKCRCSPTYIPSQLVFYNSSDNGNLHKVHKKQVLQTCENIWTMFRYYCTTVKRHGIKTIQFFYHIFPGAHTPWIERLPESFKPFLWLFGINYIYLRWMHYCICLSAVYNA